MIIATATKWILPYSHWEGCVCCLALRENNVRYTYASVWPNGVYFIRKLFLSWANIEQRVLISVRSKLFTVLALTTGVVSCCLKFGAFCVELSCDWRYNPISYEIPTFWLIHSLVLKIILLIWNTALVRFFILTHPLMSCAFWKVASEKNVAFGQMYDWSIHSVILFWYLWLRVFIIYEWWHWSAEVESPIERRLSQSECEGSRCLLRLVLMSPHGSRRDRCDIWYGNLRWWMQTQIWHWRYKKCM